MDEKIKEERNKAYAEIVKKGYVTDLDSALAFKIGFDEAVRIVKELFLKELN